ncbi:MAG: 2-C-methyl-D-erythritol 4-phosphate cytidylyltransferase [Calditrichaeota bacterium]|nr:2-C-methyl-D-erythritol 4-phosphate cytidylyltransferase [Calditrichota bacterium]
MKTSAIIVAAGQGLRSGGDLPKQFQAIGGKPVICHTLEKFEACAAVDDVLIVASQDWLPHVTQEIVERYRFPKIRQVVAGGKERQDSVYQGLKALDNPDVVVVHDAVRPFVAVDKIALVVATAAENGAAILAIPPRDTIKTGHAGMVGETLDRATLWSVQTPQAFKYDLLLAAYDRAFEDGNYSTDESALVEAIGHPVRIVEGDFENMKITVPADFKLAEALLR